MRNIHLADRSEYRAGSGPVRMHVRASACVREACYATESDRRSGLPCGYRTPIINNNNNNNNNNDNNDDDNYNTILLAVILDNNPL